MNKFLTGFFALAFAGLVLAGVAVSNYEYISSYYAPSQVQQHSIGNGWFSVVYANQTNGSVVEYPAVYGKSLNPSASWKQLCVYSPEYLVFNETNSSFYRTYYCDVPADYRKADYLIRFTVHTPSRLGCSNATYTPEPFDGCGDYRNSIVKIV